MDRINVYFKTGKVKYIRNVIDFKQTMDDLDGQVFVIHSRDDNDVPVTSKFITANIEAVVMG